MNAWINECLSHSVSNVILLGRIKVMGKSLDVKCELVDFSCLKTYNDYVSINYKMNDTKNFTLVTEIETLEQFTRGLYTYGIPLICIIGILGNMLSFKVFVFTSFGNQSSSIYIAALSLSDTGFLASLLLSWLGGGRIGVVYGHSPIWCHVMIYVTYVCSFLSVWYVVLIMIDRYEILLVFSLNQDLDQEIVIMKT